MSQTNYQITGIVQVALAPSTFGRVGRPSVNLPQPSTIREAQPQFQLGNTVRPYRIRQKRKTKAQKFKCPFGNCRKRFISKFYRKRHVQKSHAGGHSTTGTANTPVNAEFKCKWCPSIAKSKAGSVSHMRLKHPREYEDSKHTGSLDTPPGDTTTQVPLPIPTAPVSAQRVHGHRYDSTTAHVQTNTRLSDIQNLNTNEASSVASTGRNMKNATTNLFLCSYETDCAKSFINQANLKRHERLHKHRPKKLTCQLCAKVFLGFKEKSRGLRMKLCRNCYKLSKRLKGAEMPELELQQIKSINSSPLFDCKWCNRYFTDRELLSRHESRCLSEQQLV